MQEDMYKKMNEFKDDTNGRTKLGEQCRIWERNLKIYRSHDIDSDWNAWNEKLNKSN
jgi:hypothetical protein